jgi:hypothetical protein
MDWLRGQYVTYTNTCLVALHHDDPRVQVASLHSLMDFARIESMHARHTHSPLRPHVNFDW